MIITQKDMSKKTSNKKLHNAKNSKKDEFYTQITDIEREIRHYKMHFKNKVVYCNCDDPRVSNFFKYFSLNFEKLGLKKLITTCYKNLNMALYGATSGNFSLILPYKSVT